MAAAEPNGAGTNATGVLVVMGRPPSGVTEDELRRWFKGHLPEILAIECFTDARLVEIETFANPPGQELAYRFLAIYDFAGDPTAAMAALGEARAAGRMDLPDWFDEFERDCLVSWTGVPA
jgi:hypothetical protein